MSASTKIPVKHKSPDSAQVLGRLVRMVSRADDFVLGFVKCNHPRQQEEMRRQFLARLGDKRVLEVELDKPLVSLLDELAARLDSSNPPDVVCVYGLERSINELQEASPVLAARTTPATCCAALFPCRYSSGYPTLPLISSRGVPPIFGPGVPVSTSSRLKGHSGMGKALRQ